MGDEDKQFDATPQKLERARKEGQVVKSKDVSTALSLLVVFTFINLMAPFIWQAIVGLFRTLYEQIPNKSLEEILDTIAIIEIKRQLYSGLVVSSH